MRVLLFSALLVACKGDKGDDTGRPAGGDDSSGGGDDSAGGDSSEEPTFPEDPRPLVLEVSGGYAGTLVFDEPSCTWTEGVANFRAFWRNSAGDHVFVLLAEVLGAFEGPGTYVETQGRIKVALQEEAGGMNRYFATDTSAGDTVSITVTGVDAEQAWGEFEFSSLQGDTGEVTVTPQPVPIWCPEVTG